MRRVAPTISSNDSSFCARFAEPEALSAVLHILLRVIEACLRQRSRCASGRLGAVSFVQRFGAALNAHVHFHCCVVDGVFAVGHPPSPSSPSPLPADAAQRPQRSSARIVWALLLARLYEILPLQCAQCGGPVRIIAFITDGPSIHAILNHLGESTAPPEVAPARGPPLWDQAPEPVPDWADRPAPAPEFVFGQRLGW